MASALVSALGAVVDRLAAQLDAAVRVPSVVDDDAEDASSHGPRQRVSCRGRQQLEHSTRSGFGGVVAAEHQLGLAEPGEHRRHLRTRVVGQEGGGGFELDRALLQVPGRPEVATEPFVAPGHAPRRGSVTEGLAGESGGSLVAGCPAGQLGRLPEPITQLGLCGRVTSGIPQLEGPLEVAQGDARRHRARAASAAASSAHERRRLLPGPIEVEGQLARSIGAREDVRRLLPQDVGDAPVQPSSLRREQLGVDDLTDQRVPEPVAVGVTGRRRSAARRSPPATRPPADHRRPRRREPAGRGRCRVRRQAMTPSTRRSVSSRSARSAAMRSDRTAGIGCPAR